MKYLFIKTFRDIRETIGSFISILVIIFIGCLFFAGIAAASSAVTNQVNDYYKDTHLATARGEYMYVNSSAVDEIAATDGVEKAAGYDTYYSRTNSIGGIMRDITVTTLIDGIDEPYIVSGRLPSENSREMIIDTVFADKHGAKIGDEITFDINVLKKIRLSVVPSVQYVPEYERVSYTFTVCGLFHSADTIYKVNMMNTSAASDSFIMAKVRYGEIKPFTDDAVIEGISPSPVPVSVMSDGVDVFTSIAVRGKNLDYEALFNKYTLNDKNFDVIFTDPTAAAGLYKYSLTRDNFPSVTAFDAVNDTIAALAAVLPMIFFAVAAAITVISLSKTVDNQRMQIGIIQALGIGKGAVYFSYIFYALFACLIGGLAGGVVGILFIPYLLNIIYSGQFVMPPTPQHIGVLYLFLGVIISASTACLAAFFSCFKTLRTAPAQTMRPKPPKKAKRILAERWTGLWKRLGFGAKMNLRNMFLHKTKMLLSSVGIVGCIALLIALVGLKDNMAQSFVMYDASVGYDMTITTDVAVDLTDDRIYTEIAGKDGNEYMRNLTFVPDFAGRFEYKGKTADLTVAAIPTFADEKSYRYADADCVRLYSDAKGKNRIVFRDDTFVLPEMTAAELGVKPGDTVRITGYSLDNRPVDFEIKVTAVAYEYFDQKAYCAYAVFENNGVGLLADASYAKLLPWSDAGEAIDALKANDAVRDVQTFKDNYDALHKKMSLLDYAVIIFVVGAAALAIAVIYNLTATNLKERTREIATLMVLGYRRHETANMLVAENMVITGLGCAIGLPLGYGLLIWLVNLTKSFSVFISNAMTWYVALGCVVMTFAFSLIATLLLNTRMKRISMVEALKSVE